MPIEDINYLYDHSVKDSFMFFIDSFQRDRKKYPNPNEYVIDFEEPIKFVYGFDILDATMPNTMFNVDVHNNSICFVLMKSTNLTLIHERLVTRIEQLQDNSIFVNHFNTGNDFEAVVLDFAYYNSALREYVTGSVPEQETMPYNVRDQYLILTREFQVPLSLDYVAGSREIKSNGISYYYINNNNTNNTNNTNTTNTTTDTFLDALDHMQHAYVSNVDNDTMYDIIFTTNVPIPIELGTAEYIVGKNGDVPEYDVITKKTLHLEVGNYDILTVQEELQLLFAPYEFYITGADRLESNDMSKQGRVMFSHKAWPFVLNMDASTIFESIGFEPFAIKGNVDYNPVPLKRGNDRLFSSLYDPDRARFYVKSPGICNMAGTPYVILRCKEIEDHISSAVTFNKFSTGIGAFKMHTIRDNSQLRFDFTTFLMKPFHPIGKLSKLTFKFQTVRGVDYDFKGYNHNMLISVKYFAPNMTRTFTESVLNPNYDPDYLKYVTKYVHDDDGDSSSSNSSSSSSSDVD